MSGRKGYFLILFLLLALFCSFFGNTVYAAEAGGEYLQYQEPQSPTHSSWLSTVAYVFSLLVTFALVIGLAYFASRFLGQRMGGLAGVGAASKVLRVIPLGQNKGIYLVDIANQVLVLGVTEHSITVLKEITEASEVERIRAEQLTTEVSGQFDKAFQKQLASLQQFSKKFPTVFDGYKRDGQKDNGEKR